MRLPTHPNRVESLCAPGCMSVKFGMGFPSKVLAVPERARSWYWDPCSVTLGTILGAFQIQDQLRGLVDRELQRKRQVPGPESFLRALSFWVSKATVCADCSVRDGRHVESGSFQLGLNCWRTSSDRADDWGSSALFLLLRGISCLPCQTVAVE